MRCFVSQHDKENTLVIANRVKQSSFLFLDCFGTSPHNDAYELKVAVMARNS
ncbi:MAG: hypothetical protein ACK5M3_15280 [Dysgonomonas sp.]